MTDVIEHGQGDHKPVKRSRSPKQRGLERKRKAAKEAVIKIDPAATTARMRGRHWGVVISFVSLVILPILICSLYLMVKTADQYASFSGFTVRQTSQPSPAVEILGGITDLSGASTADTDILYNFLYSQELVDSVNQELDLYAMWSKPQDDWVFGFDAAGTIEDLVAYWTRMVSVSYDGGAGLIELRTLAFDPDDAQRINEKVFEESSRMINELSAIAREDATRYAKDDLDRSVERLKVARNGLTVFRNENQIVDPDAAIQGQVGLLNTLQQQLADALIELDLLRETTRTGDPRIAQLTRKSKVIRARIAEERRKLGFGSLKGETGRAFAEVIGEYESLIVDLEFAEQSYTSARANYDTAVAEANRQNRYLAAYLKPTKAERSDFPKRLLLMGLFGLFAVLIWAVGVLVFYSLKDRQARL